MCSHNICIHQIKFDEKLFLLFYPTEDAGHHFNPGSVVECLTLDGKAAGLSLTHFTVLCP